MRPTHCSILTLAVFGLAASAAAEEKSAITFNFDADKPGEPPAGFEFARTGKGAEGKWGIRAAQDTPMNHVLKGALP